MKKFFTRQILIKSAEQCVKRFPLTVGFIGMLTLFLLTECWGADDLFTSHQFSVIIYYLTVGGLLSLSLRLWSEELKKQRIAQVTGLLCHLLLIADACYLYALPEDFQMLEIGLGHGSMLTILAISIGTFSFFREKDDIASWNFSLQLISQAFASWIVGGIMCGGLSLLTASFSGLFGIEVDNNYYKTWSILFCITLPSLLFIGQIPSGESKHDRTRYASAFTGKTVRYLFLPLLGCYLIVLYAYLLKILVQWQLPDGWVARLVTALMGGCIAVEFGLFPTLRQGAGTFERRAARWLPVAILPLLVLMTIGVGRRISDYGITLNRLYLFALNIWFYIVCTGLYFLRERRVQWIALSFAGIFMLTSALPVNFVSFTQRYMIRSISALINETHVKKLPMNEEEYIDWLMTLPPQQALLVNNRLRILNYDFQNKEIRQFIEPEIHWWRIDNCIEKTPQPSDATTVAEEQYTNLSASVSAPLKIKLSDGASDMTLYKEDYREIPCEEWKTGIISFTLHDTGSAADTIRVRITDLRKANAQSDMAALELTCSQSDNRFILTGFSLFRNSSDKNLHFRFSGCHITRTPIH